MEEESYLSVLQNGAKESVKFFSNFGRVEREKKAFEAFLRCWDIVFDESIYLVPDNDPPDCIYDGHYFEIAELLDNGRRRHKEYKDNLKNAEAATKGSDLLEECRPDEEIGFSEVIEELMVNLEKKRRKYEIQEIKYDCFNIIVYVNYAEKYFKILKDCNLKELREQGWCSVSMVTRSESYVFFADRDAPDFIKSRVNMKSDFKVGIFF